MPNRELRKRSGSYILLPTNGVDRMTLDELLERLKEYDLDDLIELLKLDTESLLEAMEWYIQENFDDIAKEVGEVETPWDYD